jgi:hypothetical protein
VFFVLTTLILGVLTYMAYDEKATLADAAKKANDDKSSAEKKWSQEQEKVYLYKTLLGINTEQEFGELKAAKNKDTVKAEYAAATQAMQNKVGGLVEQQAKNFIGAKFEVNPATVVRWSTFTGDAPEKEPESAVVNSLVAALAQSQLAKIDLAAQLTNLKSQEQAFVEARTRADDAVKQFKAETALIPAKIDEGIKKAKEEAEARAKEYSDKTLVYNKDTRNFQDVLGARDITIAQLQEKVKNLQTQIERLEGTLELREDPFAFDKPHGKVIRQQGNIVDINLGSADNVRAGLTFSVQPAETPNVGLQSRMKPRVKPNGQPVTENGRPVMEVVSKGTIEVIEVLGPNLSQARISSEADSIREKVRVGDVLYNAAWRKGAADHVALFGVFDVDGDGSDDIKAVIRDLGRMGVVVDAYFDLEKKRWEGRLTEQTTYAVEGYYPTFTGGAGDALASAKSQIDQALLAARKEAKERGAKVVKFRDFFPRIGYRVKLDVAPETINRAFNKYLTTLPTSADPMMPPN